MAPTRTWSSLGKGLVWAWLLLGSSVLADIYTSLHGLRELQTMGNLYVEKVKAQTKPDDKSLPDIERLCAAIVEDSGYQGLYDVEHPVGAYKLIQAWLTLPSLLETEQQRQDFFQSLSGNVLPEVTERDHIGAARAILRVQRVFNLSTAALAQGDVYGRLAAPLTLADVEYIGLRALDVAEYDLMVYWFELALSLAPPTDHTTKSRLLFYLARAHYHIGDYKTASEIAQQAFDYAPGDPNIKADLLHYEVKRDQSWLRDEELVTLATYQRHLHPDKMNYESLCRGEGINALSPELFCRYRPTLVPYAFVKEEVLSVDPRVMILHDVICERDMQLLKEIASDKLDRARVWSFADGQVTKLSDDRVSMLGWIWDSEYFSDGRPVQALSDHVTYVTGLDAEYADYASKSEPFQVINYGLGGQYEPHLDHFSREKGGDEEEELYLATLPQFLKGSGDRIATFLYYLSDVDVGGGTVFPRLNALVRPIKGAAAFWYNIGRNGEKDDRTMHAGCPVALGEKWVANKWIRERGQEWRRPCGLHYDDID